MYTDVHSIGRARVNDRKVYLYTQRHGGRGGRGTEIPEIDVEYVKRNETREIERSIIYEEWKREERRWEKKKNRIYIYICMYI